MKRIYYISSPPKTAEPSLVYLKFDLNPWTSSRFW